MSSAQSIDGTKILAAQETARADATAEKQEFAIGDALSKDKAALQAKDGEVDMTDAIAQAGRQLGRGVIERRLKTLNPNLRFERSLADPQKQGIYQGDRFLCGMEFDRSPEFTVNFVGEDGRGKQELLNQVRGWRAVIDTLIRKGAIEAEATYSLFQTRRGRESANWALMGH